MQCQVKTRSLLALLIIILSVAPLGAVTSEHKWEMLNSPGLEIEQTSSAQGEVISSYIPFFKEIGQILWGWDPSKELKNTTESIYIEPRPSKFKELMRSLFVEFDVSNTANFRKVWFSPGSDVKFRGLFGFHDFVNKRPFIILRLGIHGNVDELIAERFLLKLIYDDLDANVLVIESLTSHAFLSRNKNISLGGVDEGIQTFLAINEVTNSKIAPLISAIHIVSLSMGAHGTFVTAMLDQKNGQKITSILNFCPLINLKETFDYHNKPESNLQNGLVDLWNVRRLKAVFDIYPDEPALREWWQTIFDLKPRFTLNVLGLVNRDRKQPLVSVEQIEKSVTNMKWPEGLREHFKNSSGVFDLNNFWKLYKGVKTPMMIYTTPEDPLVLNELNSELIFRGKQEGDFSHLKFHRLERGTHCGLAPVYRWDHVVKLVKEGLIL